MKLLAEANERLVVPLHPTTEQKLRAHERIKHFASFAAPRKLRPGNFRPETEGATISSQKLAYETVRLLTENEWMRAESSLDLNMISAAAGNLVMAALACECSSISMPPLTDDPHGFVASCDLVLDELGIARGLVVGGDDEKISSTDGDLSFLLEGIPYIANENGDFDCKMLAGALEAREKPDIAGLRGKFRDRVDKFLTQIEGAQAPERQIIRDCFKEEVSNDLRALKKELSFAGLESLVTKEGVVAIGIGALVGTAATPGVGSLLGAIAGLFAYRKNRRDKLDKHWTSWVFAAKHPRFSVV